MTIQYLAIGAVDGETTHSRIWQISAEEDEFIVGYLARVPDMDQMMDSARAAYLGRTESIIIPREGLDPNR